MEPEDPELPVETVVAEIRTQRLAIVDSAGVEHAVIEVGDGVVECRLGGPRSGMPCEVLVSVGEHEQGTFIAGIELWANGDSVGGALVTVQGSHMGFLRFPNG
jgi:hypothetical protein